MKKILLVLSLLIFNGVFCSEKERSQLRHRIERLEEQNQLTREIHGSEGEFAELQRRVDVLERGSQYSRKEENESCCCQCVFYSCAVVFALAITPHIK